MKTSFTVKVLFLSCIIVSSSHACQKKLTNYRVNDIDLQNMQAIDKKTKSVYRAIKLLPKSDFYRIQIINRGGARDLEVRGRLTLRTFGHSSVDFIPWLDSLPHQQRECFISAFEYIRQQRSV